MLQPEQLPEIALPVQLRPGRRAQLIGNQFVEAFVLELQLQLFVERIGDLVLDALKLRGLVAAVGVVRLDLVPGWSSSPVSTIVAS